MPSLLKKYRLSLNKNLGQHFLANESYLQKIVDAASLNKDSRVFEIGPGSGNLTRLLVATGAQLIALEKDTRWCEILKTEIHGENFQLIEGDILEFDPSCLRLYALPPYKALGNLPYNIATEIIFHLLENRHLFSDFFFLIQKEVANRLKASEGGKDYGVPSLMVQLFCEVKTLFHIPPGAFVPPPKVDSSLVHLKIHQDPRWPVKDLKLFKQVVRTAFQQRRKTLVNSLTPFFPSKKEGQTFLELQGISPNTRPEELSLPTWTQLSNALA